MPLLPLSLLLALAPAADDPKKPPAAPAQTPVRAPAVPVDLADWTPRPAAGKSAPWEKMSDKDWADARFRDMDTGPALTATIDYPLGKGTVRNYRGLAVKVGDGAVVYDRATMRLGAAWTGGFVLHSDKRFGLLDTPTMPPGAKRVFANPAIAGWAVGDAKFAATPRATAPDPASGVRYKGFYRNGDRVTLAYTVAGTDVLESPSRITVNGTDCVAVDVRVGPSKRPLTKLGMAPDSRHTFPPSDAPRDARFVSARNVTAPPPPDLAKLTEPGPARWGKPLVTKLVRGKADGPFAVDTLTIPYENPFKTLFFCTGVDFLPDGRVAMCTAHGDVWLATVDEKADSVSWQRFATGMYQPLGLKVVDGKVVVIERGQLTRLHDANADGEADFYEDVCDLWHIGDGQHSFDTCLETDPAGNFYFFKTGDADVPNGGCLMRVSKDGSKAEIFASGFRHPIGLGMSPTGIVTGADQEGNWMPATRVDQYKPGGFYGDMRTHHRPTPPKTYDGPLCWLPREVDNSAGGQVWVPDGAFGPLAGLPLHLSYGRCKAYLLLRQEYPGGVQGGVSDLGLTFLSGVCRGRFHPTDGHLYVCGLNGWTTAANADGCLQRVRTTGKPLTAPVKMTVVPEGVELTFATPLDRSAATDPARYRAAWWDYKWAAEYGSKRYKPSEPGVVGQDDVPIAGVDLLPDGKTVRVRVTGGMRPVMQMQVGFNVATADGTPAVGSVFLTIHDVGK